MRYSAKVPSRHAEANKTMDDHTKAMDDHTRTMDVVAQNNRWLITRKIMGVVNESKRWPHDKNGCPLANTGWPQQNKCRRLHENDTWMVT